MSQTTTYLESVEVLERESEVMEVALAPAEFVQDAGKRERGPRQKPTSRPFNYRQLFWKWHLYAGLFGSPLLVLIALTGAILVFGPELDHALRPDLWRIEPPAGSEGDSAKILDQPLIDAVRGKFPKAKLNSYRQNEGPHEPYQFLLLTPGVRGVHDVWVNPYTAEVVGERQREYSLVRIAEQLHRRLLAGEVGSSIIEFITGWCIVLTLTGLYLWWPKSWRQLYNGLVPTMHGSAYKVNWRLHNTVGFWSAVVLLLLAVSGMVFSTFTGGMFNRLSALTGARRNTPAAKKAKPAEGATLVSIDDLLGKLREGNVHEEKSAGDRFSVQFSREGEGGVTISTLRKERATWAHMKEQQSWTFDSYSGDLLKHSEWRDVHPFVKFRQLSLVIHFGSIFGMPTRIVALAACLAMPLLAVTGFLIWWWKRLGKAAQATRQGARPVARAEAAAERISLWIVAGLVGLCIIFPTIGVSFLFVVVFELVRAWWRGRRVSRLAA